ncbi:MAG TPA: DUF6141 family protein [Saprospiraceae bacterium]|nr:DUF6141 family protein [Saprospiraceae bacterium]
MKDEILFSEKQKFIQWWLWLILLGSNGFLAYGVITQVVLGKTFGSRPSGDVEILLVFGLTLMLSLLFFSFKLETLIKTDGVYVRFFPFHISFRHFTWEQIRKANVRQYNALLEYRGWGLRGFGKNRAFNVSGNQGLQLEFEDYKKLLIGTRKPDEIREALQKVAIGNKQ